jgi:hypothetical protein
LQTINKYNPISYGIDGRRGFVISGFDSSLPCDLFALGTIAPLCITGATSMCRRRVA